MIISIVIGCMFILMLTTSYAWYSYENGSTVFEATTDLDDLNIVYTTGQTINTTTAVPITLDEVSANASRNYFSISRKEGIVGSGITVSVSLTDISIDEALEDSYFKIDLLCDGVKVAGISGSDITSTEQFLANVKLNDLGSDFELRIYILDSGSNQNAMQGKSFSAKIKIGVVSREGVVNFTYPTIATYISDLYDNGSKTSVTSGGSEVITQVTAKGLMRDSFGNIRYYGTNPDNYISFNGELWRIIGVFDVEDEEGVVEKRVKLIRNESIGSVSWDSKSDASTESNNWSTAVLNDRLNNYYFLGGMAYYPTATGQSSAIGITLSLNEVARGMVGQAKYYLGGTGYTVSSNYADDFYNVEHGTSVHSGNPTSWVGAVGLMYPSDYLYAADFTPCYQANASYNDSRCVGTNWLYIESSEWTIMADITSGLYVFYIDSDGRLLGNSQVYNALAVRPVVYLNSDVIINGGNGSMSSPYTLSN